MKAALTARPFFLAALTTTRRTRSHSWRVVMNFLPFPGVPVSVTTPPGPQLPQERAARTIQCFAAAGTARKIKMQTASFDLMQRKLAETSAVGKPSHSAALSIVLTKRSKR
jgi:hypothetical protein